MNVARETKIQLQALMSEKLEEEDEPLEEETHFATPTIPKEDSNELKGANLNDLVSYLSPDKGNSKGQLENLTSPQDSSIGESQDPLEEEDPEIVLHAKHLGRKIGKHAPFFISLLVNELVLHNCMLDSGASTNIMPLREMQQLGLEVSRLYRNVCGVDSRPIQVCGLIKDLKVSLATFLDISLVMNVVLIDIPDV